MQGSEEFEADYYREILDDEMRGTQRRSGREWPSYEPQDRPGNEEWNDGRSVRRGRRPACFRVYDELWQDMELFESFYGEESAKILTVIREICGEIDADGCIAVEGEITPEIFDRLIDQVLAESDASETAGDGLWREMTGILLSHELMRRRARRRMRIRRRI